MCLEIARLASGEPFEAPADGGLCLRARATLRTRWLDPEQVELLAAWFAAQKR